MYIDGNVVSETSRKYITNMLVATASAKIDDSFTSTDESDENISKDCTLATTNMQLVQRTLNGILHATRRMANALLGVMHRLFEWAGLYGKLRHYYHMSSRVSKRLLLMMDAYLH